MPGRITIHAVLLIVAMLYGANYTIAKIALPKYIEPFGFILLRLIMATLLFWVLGALLSREKVQKEDYWKLIQCGFFGAAFNMLMFFQGLSMTNPINASVIMTLSPIVVLAVAYLLGQEKLNRVKIAGVVLGAIGAYLLVTKDGFSLQNNTLVGDLFIIVNASAYAFYLVIVKPLMLKYKPITVIKWVFLFGSIMCLPFGMADLAEVEWTAMPPEAWISVVYVILGATFTVYLLNIWALQYVNSSVVGTYIYLQPIISTAIAVTFRHDPLDVKTVIYSLLIMGGVYLVGRR